MTDTTITKAEGPPWPTDHPGRSCNLCGLRVYSLWVDDTPPPGTCVEKCTEADKCGHNVDAAVSQAFLRLVQSSAGGTPPMPDSDAFARRGLDADTIMAFARDEFGRQNEERAFGSWAGLQIQGQSLEQFLTDDFDQALQRAAAVVHAMAFNLLVALQNEEDHTKRDVMRARFRRVMRTAAHDLLDPELDYEDGEPE